MIRPLHDVIILERLPEDTQLPSGLYIPQIAQTKPLQARVLAAGPGKLLPDGRRLPMDVQAGDIVCFDKWVGIETRAGGEDVFVMREGDVIGILEP